MRPITSNQIFCHDVFRNAVRILQDATHVIIALGKRRQFNLSLHSGTGLNQLFFHKLLGNILGNEQASSKLAFTGRKLDFSKLHALHKKLRLKKRSPRLQECIGVRASVQQF